MTSTNTKMNEPPHHSEKQAMHASACAERNNTPWIGPVGLTMLVVALFAAIYIYMQPIKTYSPAQVSPPVVHSSEVVLPAPSTAQPMAKVDYTKEIHHLQQKATVLLDRLRQDNLKARDNFVRKINKDYLRQKSRIPVFIDEITSIQSQVALAMLYASNGPEDLSRSVQQEYQDTVVSPYGGSFNARMHSYRLAFQHAIESNRADFYADLRLLLTANDLPEGLQRMLAKQLDAVMEQERKTDGEIGRKAASILLVATTGGLIAQRSAEVLLPLILSRISSRVLTLTRINLFGLIIGGAVDIYLSESAEQEIQQTALRQIAVSQRTMVTSVTSIANHYNAQVDAAVQQSVSQILREQNFQ